MTQHTFKSLLNEGIFKRAHAVQVNFETLKIEPGFNLRDEDESLAAHREAMLNHLRQGGTFPPIEVRVGSDGGVYIVDGHNRHWVYSAALAEGLPLRDPKTGEFWVEVQQFRGNDVDRTKRIIDSQEGKKLGPLELARGYKRLQGFGLSSEEIAKMFSKTRQHVDGLLILANANHDVHALVKSGAVAAAVAVDVVRKYGENAGAFLRGELDKAAGQGKKKITRGTMNGKPLPPKVVGSLVEELDVFMGQLPKATRVALADLEKRLAAGGKVDEGTQVHIPAAALLGLLTEHGKLNEARAKAEERARARQAKAAQGEITDQDQDGE
jgi:ParB-like chromosome segregation protein Spo0J